MTDMINLDNTPSKGISLQQSFYKMLTSNFATIDRFDHLMNIIAEQLFSEDMIESIMNDREQLLALYNLLDKKKSSRGLGLAICATCLFPKIVRKETR